MSLYEISLISFGIILGAVFYEFFGKYLLFFGVLFVLPATYILSLWVRQFRESQNEKDTEDNSY
jgi:putative Mn2+ efflux pump MntP